MQEGENTSGVTVNSEVTPPKRPRYKVSAVVALVALLLVLALGIGAWFGGSWWERREWEPKYDDLEARYGELRKDNQALDTANGQLSKDNALYLGQYGEYLGIMKEVNRRLGYSCDVRQSFVTPNDADVAARVLAITGGYSSDASEQWSDYDAMYDWVVANIKYSYDSSLPRLPLAPNLSLLTWQKDYWRTPSETLEDKTGDCEDMACLLASMVRNYTQSRYACWVITWYSQDSGHAAVAIPVTGGNLAILDPAGNQTIGFGGHQSISVTATMWLGKWPSESGIHVSGVFSDTECDEFANTAEFVAWASVRA